MRLNDFSVLDDGDSPIHAYAAQEAFNRTGMDYPRDSTVSAVFADRAGRHPDALAILALDGGGFTYRQVDLYANRMARLLLNQGLGPEERVGLMLSDPYDLAAAMVGVLRAGGAYLPIDPNTPALRIQYMLDDNGTAFLIGERRHLRLINRLQWECPALYTILYPDSPDIHAEIEPRGALMRRDIWDHIGREMFDDISGGGWKSSYTGEWLSREVMDQYGDNIEAKLAPHIRPDTRILEIGCSSGISLFRLAPHCGFYYGIDLSEEILSRTEREVARRRLSQVRLRCLEANDIDQLDESDFDIVILNSVVQCFSGHNYLRSVLRKAIALMRTRGLIFLGDLSDQDLKAEFIESLAAFQQAHPGSVYRTHLDRSEDLFIARTFLEDLRHDLPVIEAVETSRARGTVESELSEFGYDALLRVNRSATQAPTQPRRKRQLDRRALDAIGADPVPERGEPLSLAYVMYTSGTTGQPKGVMVEHRAILRLVLNTNYIRLDATDRILQTGSLAFDATTFEVWGALLNGGAFARAEENALCDPPVLKRLIRSHGITTLFLTTGLFNLIVDHDPDIFSGLRHLLIGGERASPSHFNRIRRDHPELHLANVYGPTENTTFTTYHDIDRIYQRDIPIGRPIANTEVLILDGMLPVPIGVAGELCAGGDGLARGYLNDPELTLRKFVPHPFRPEKRLYRTGDSARWLPDGTIEFLGRIDEQVKIRGFRVEPGEIERRLLEREEIREAIVVAHEHGTESRELAAYLTGAESVDDNELCAHLRSTLPDYMIPAHFVRLDKLPLKANGKVDAAALPVPVLAQRGAARLWVPPENETEQRLLEIWEEALDCRSIGVTDDFFQLGGHSLKAVKLISLVQEKMGVAIPFATVFAASTVRKLAAAILDATRFGVAGIDQAMVLLNQGQDRRPIFAFPPATADALGYGQLAACLEPYAFYGFNFIESATRMSDYADHIASVSGADACVLFGYSGGGNLAFHVAGELESRGQRVDALVLLDSARFERRFQFPPEEVHWVATQFLDTEGVKAYLTSPLLRDKAFRNIQRYYERLSNSEDNHRINADIYLVLSEDSPEPYRNNEGRIICNKLGWAEVTRGRFSVYPGQGDHNHMLHPPHLEPNFQLLREIFGIIFAK